MYDKIFLEINKAKQGIFLQCENSSHPVLLFLHGGPGSPEVAMDAHYKSGLEKIFTVCWWEQRGCGISFNRKIKPEEMNVAQMIADTVSVAEYLKKRFKKEKIYLMGHSWGSFLGILTANKYPELFHAYIGIGQIKKNSESECLGYDYMLEEYRKLGNKKMIRKFEKCKHEIDGKSNMKYLATMRSNSLNELGVGIFHKKATMMGIIKDVFSFKGYTFWEKINFARGSMFSIQNLWDEIYDVDLAKEAFEFNVPIYIFHGKYDYQVSYVLAKEYFGKIIAPIKGFYTFHNSAHSLSLST